MLKGGSVLGIRTRVARWRDGMRRRNREGMGLKDAAAIGRKW